MEATKKPRTKTEIKAIAKDWIIAALNGRMYELIGEVDEDREPGLTDDEKQELKSQLIRYLDRLANAVM